MSVAETLRIHHFEPFSYSNGPGKRAVLWLQGCTLNCPGCFNPQTHSPTGGASVQLSGLLSRIFRISPSIEGITISGGEPLQQLRPLLRFLAEIRQKTHLSVILFTGFTPEEINTFPASNKLSELIDVLIAGRYDKSHPSENLWIGSSNKTIHFFSSRYSMADLLHVPTGEIIIEQSGELLFSGIDPLIFR
ncbi:organic radical activating enzymes [Bellilinea caldifistulae]|uniref:4Fe-4S single cluster domain-containing protein n=1 Tax=Bellilinea caldifistulae TaxID=360411 RepID=UPI0007846CB9|nr:4Fe-4S single cluster domain-containing protein [Bellilinea caldifistulae]GAP10649.1 organic radical activating enzymes [Bellilinea caldifistulae]